MCYNATHTTVHRSLLLLPTTTKTFDLRMVVKFQKQKIRKHNHIILKPFENLCIYSRVSTVFYLDPIFSNLFSSV